MIESIEFRNFKVLRDCKLPLGPCNVLVGPNGSGKSTVLFALELLGGRRVPEIDELVTADLRPDVQVVVELFMTLGGMLPVFDLGYRWQRGTGTNVAIRGKPPDNDLRRANAFRTRFRVYSLDARAIAAPVQLKKDMELGSDGAGLAGVLDALRDHHPERFALLNEALSEWIPEFSGLSFDLDREGRRFFFLRTATGGSKIPSAQLSQGTLLALAMLTLAYLPDPPTLIALEEPDRGIHPRLLRRVRDALYRLAYPESCGEKRPAVQVVATTHSPYFLDQFAEHPEEIVIANRVGDNVRFERLSEQPYLEEVLSGAPLGEIWYTGILGGVPSES